MQSLTFLSMKNISMINVLQKYEAKKENKWYRFFRSFCTLLMDEHNLQTTFKNND